MSDFTIRHYEPDKDLSSLSHMLTEIESVERDGEDTSEDYLRYALTWPNYRPAEDVWVAEKDGTLVGYGVALEQPSQRCTVYVVVHPSHRRQGLGRQLLDLTLGRAREFGSKNILAYSNGRNAASQMFLEKHRFGRVGSSGFMMASADQEIPDFEFPTGFTLKRFSELNDLYILAVALIDCYLGMWGHQHSEKPSADNPNVMRFLAEYGAYNILLLFDKDGNVSGMCSAKSKGRKDENGNNVDLLDAPGVIQKYRRDGLQRPLVLAGLRRLREQGQRPVKLEFFGDDEKTLDIYRLLGFELTQQYIAYHKELA
ncbi:MAG: GNAT family N-acetyltransferase [Chloroflexota bacterium]